MLDLLESTFKDELKVLHDEKALLHTAQLLVRAQRLKIPIKTTPDHELDEDWEKGTTGTWYLSGKGVAKVREEIRKEEKWRREGRAHLILWLSAMTGLIGTITGLVAVLLK